MISVEKVKKLVLFRRNFVQNRKTVSFVGLLCRGSKNLTAVNFLFFSGRLRSLRLGPMATTLYEMWPTKDKNTDNSCTTSERGQEMSAYLGTKELSFWESLSSSSPSTKKWVPIFYDFAQGKPLCNHGCSEKWKSRKNQRSVKMLWNQLNWMLWEKRSLSFLFTIRPVASEAWKFSLHHRKRCISKEMYAT